MCFISEPYITLHTREHEEKLCLKNHKGHNTREHEEKLCLKNHKGHNTREHEEKLCLKNHKGHNTRRNYALKTIIIMSLGKGSICLLLPLLSNNILNPRV